MGKTGIIWERYKLPLCCVFLFIYVAVSRDRKNYFRGLSMDKRLESIGLYSHDSMPRFSLQKSGFRTLTCGWNWIKADIIISTVSTLFHVNISTSEVILNCIRWNNTTYSELKRSEEEAVRSVLLKNYPRVCPLGTGNILRQSGIEQANISHVCDHFSYPVAWPGLEPGSS
jgi:hypothetical protein